MIDIAKTLEKYQPSEICDDWEDCIDQADREMRDLYCEHCDIFRELVELEELNNSNLQTT